MEKDNFLDIFDSQEKAIHHCLWLNFKYRIAGICFSIIDGPDNNFAVCEQATADEMDMTFLDILPKNYVEMSYDEIRHIQIDKEPLPHLEALMSHFSTMDGEILRYILYAKIPLEKLIRFELADRGFDKNHRWVGFEKANEIWLHDN
jgi:hypothetical protein